MIYSINICMMVDILAGTYSAWKAEKIKSYRIFKV